MTEESELILNIDTKHILCSVNNFKWIGMILGGLILPLQMFFRHEERERRIPLQELSAVCSINPMY